MKAIISSPHRGLTRSGVAHVALAMALTGFANFSAHANESAIRSPDPRVRSPQTPPPIEPCPPMADSLNSALDAITGKAPTRLTPTAAPLPGTGTERQRPSEQAGVNLADQLNRSLDRIMEDAGRLVRRGTSGSGRAFECIFGIPPVYVAQVIDFSARRTVKAVGQTATELGLSGPVIFPSPLEFPPKRAIETAQPLTIAHAWRTGWANDPQVRAARAAQAVVSERLPLARSQLLPQAQLGAQRIDNSLTREGLNTLQQRQEIFDRYESGNVSLQVRQPLFRAQQVIAVTQALAFVDESMATLEREMQNFSVRLTVAYFEALLARDQMDLIDTQRRFLEQAVAAERKALMAGFGTRTDVDAAAAKLDLNQAQALEARQQQEMARRQLEAYVAHPIGELAKLNISSLERLTEIDADLGDWVLRAQAASPEVRQLLAQREASRQEMKKARAGHLPTVDFVAQVQRSRSENTLSPQAQFTNRSMGVQLNLPLYSGGFVNSQTRQASAEVQRLDEQIDAAKADLGVRVHKEFRGVVEGRARVKALEVAARSADVALDSARKSVKAGIRTTVDVLNAEQSRMQVMRDLAQARYSTIVSLVRLHALTGGADEAFMTRIDSALQVQQ